MPLFPEGLTRTNYPNVGYSDLQQRGGTSRGSASASTSIEWVGAAPGGPGYSAGTYYTASDTASAAVLAVERVHDSGSSTTRRLSLSHEQGLLYTNVDLTGVVTSVSLTDPIVALMRFNKMFRTERDRNGRIRIFDFDGNLINWNLLIEDDGLTHLSWVNEDYESKTVRITYKDPEGHYVFVYDNIEVPEVVQVV